MLAVLALLLWSHQRTLPFAPPTAAAHSASSSEAAAPAGLPPEVAGTLALIRRGGPFAHRQDGAVFENRERELPAQPHGYYHEYTVETPGAQDRGARRIITGGDPPNAYYYTKDHYRSFRTLETPR
jgi:guanyl-specific ribonuclease Sa